MPVGSKAWLTYTCSTRLPDNISCTFARWNPLLSWPHSSLIIILPGWSKIWLGEKQGVDLWKLALATSWGQQWIFRASRAGSCFHFRAQSLSNPRLEDLHPYSHILPEKTAKGDHCSKDSIHAHLDHRNLLHRKSPHAEILCTAVQSRSQRPCGCLLMQFII